ncbi:hypothetical protein BYT27DRAFT_7217735 [Phlegmacium glaucopus]|nr:hypothetical protein BYT27DRAFT_7217735 [Phlegmacium glaucopus]
MQVVGVRVEVVDTELKRNCLLQETAENDSRRRYQDVFVYQRVIQEIVKDPSSFKGYSKKKGIIATSVKFLKFLKMQQGVEELGNLDGKGGEPGAANDNFSNTIIVPVAIPGCGAFSQILFRIIFSTFLSFLSFENRQNLGFVSFSSGSGHTQGDDVHAKKPVSIFTKKNNHLKEHRRSIYCCWILWGCNLRVVILPSILAFTFLATWLAANSSQYILSDHVFTTHWGAWLYAGCRAMSMTVNALVTGLIIFKIFNMYHEAKSVSGNQILGVLGITPTIIQESMIESSVGSLRFADNDPNSMPETGDVNIVNREDDIGVRLSDDIQMVALTIKKRGSVRRWGNGSHCSSALERFA